MEMDCISEYDESLDISVEDEEEEEDESQSEEPNNSHLKKQKENEDMKSRLDDAVEAVQSLAWDTNSSRCSTSQASETSITSGIYNMENSYTDCSPGKVTSLMDERKAIQKTTHNFPCQASLPSTERIGADSKTCDLSEMPVQENAQDKELDPSNPQSWPFQVQPSKIKDYLVQITQEVVASGPEEKENALMKKGELPLKGTVRARILQITAVLEERNKKIFRRVNNQDMPPPSEVIRKPREQPKIFSRQDISVSLRHIERSTMEKKNKKEGLGYNLRHVESKTSKHALYSKEEKQTHSFLPRMQNKASEKLPKFPISLADKAKKLDTKQDSPATHSSVHEMMSVIQATEPQKKEKKGKQPLSPNRENIIPAKPSNNLTETEKEKIQVHPLMSSEVPNIIEEARPLREKKAAQPCSVDPAEPLVKEIEHQTESTRIVLSDSAVQDVQYTLNTTAIHCEPEESNLAKINHQSMVLSQLEVKGVPWGNSVGEVEKQEVPLPSPETTYSIPEKERLPSSVREAKKQEEEHLAGKNSDKEKAEEQFIVPLENRLEEIDSLRLVHGSETQEIGTILDSTAIHDKPDLTGIRNQSLESTVPSQLEVKGASLRLSVGEEEKQFPSMEIKDFIADSIPEKVRLSSTVGEADKQVVPLHSTESTGSNFIPEKQRLSSSVREAEKQEQLSPENSNKEKSEEQFSVPFQIKSEHISSLPLVHESQTQEIEKTPDSAAMHGKSEVSDLADSRIQSVGSMVPSQLKVKGAHLGHSAGDMEMPVVPLPLAEVAAFIADSITEKSRLTSSFEEAEKQEVTLPSTESTDAILEKERLSSSVEEAGKQEVPLNSTETADFNADFIPEKERLTSSFEEAEKQEVPLPSTESTYTILEKERLLSSVEEAGKQEVPLNSTETADFNADFIPEKERFTSSFEEAEKQEVPFPSTEIPDSISEKEQLPSSVGEGEKEEVSLHSTEIADTICEKETLPYFVRQAEKQEQLAWENSEKEKMEEQFNVPFQTKSVCLPSLPLVHKSEAQETEPVSAAMHGIGEVSDLAENRNQSIGSMVPSQSEVKDVPLGHSAGEAEKQEDPLHSTEIADTICEKEILPSFVLEAGKQEIPLNSTEIPYFNIDSIPEKVGLTSSFGEVERKDFSLYSAEIADTIPEKERSSVREAERQEEQKLTWENSEKEKMDKKSPVPLQTKSEHLSSLPLVHESGTQEIGSELDSATMHDEPEVADLAENRNRSMGFMVPSQLEDKGTPLGHSVEEVEKPEVPLPFTETADFIGDSIPEMAKLLSSVGEAEKQEVLLHSTESTDSIPEKESLPSFARQAEKQEEQKLTWENSEKEKMEESLPVPFQTKSEHLSSLPLVNESGVHEIGSELDLAAMHGISEMSDLPENRNRPIQSIVPSQLKVKDALLGHNVTEMEKQEFPLHSAEATDSILEKEQLSSSVGDAGKQAVPLNSTRVAYVNADSFPEMARLTSSSREAEKQEVPLQSTEIADSIPEKERSSVREAEKQEEQQFAWKTSNKEKMEEPFPVLFQTKSEHLSSLPLVHKSETQDIETAPDSAAMHDKPEVSELAENRNRSIASMVSSQLEVKGTHLGLSVGEVEKLEVSLPFTETADFIGDPIPEMVKLPSSVGEAGKQEILLHSTERTNSIPEKKSLPAFARQAEKQEEHLAWENSRKEKAEEQFPVPFQTKSEHLSSLSLVHESGTQEIGSELDLAAMHGISEMSDLPENRNRPIQSIVPSQLKVKDALLGHNVREMEKQEFPLHSTEATDSILEKEQLSSSVGEAGKQAVPLNSTRVTYFNADSFPEMARLTSSSREAEKQEVPLQSTEIADSIPEKERSSVREAERQEEQQFAWKTSNKEKMEEPFPVLFQTKSEHLSSLPLVHKSETQDIETAPDSAAMHDKPEVSELAENRNRSIASMVSSQLEVKGTHLGLSVGEVEKLEVPLPSTEIADFISDSIPPKARLTSFGEAEKQKFPLHSTESTDSIPEKGILPSFVRQTEKQEEHLAWENSRKEKAEEQFPVPFPSKLECLSSLPFIHESETQGIGSDSPAIHDQPEVADLAEKVEKQEVNSTETTDSVPEREILPSFVKEAEEQEEEQFARLNSDKEMVEEQYNMPFQTKSDHLPLLHLVHEPEVHKTESAHDLASTTQETQHDISKTVEGRPGPSYPFYSMVEVEAQREDKLESELARKSMQTPPSLNISLEEKHPHITHLRDKAETQAAPPEFHSLGSPLPIPNTWGEETQQHSMAFAKSETEHLLNIKSIEAPQESKSLEKLVPKDKEVTEPLTSSECVLPVSSSPAANVEMQGPQAPLLKAAAPLLDQPNSDLSRLAEQMGNQTNSSYSTEEIPVIAEASVCTMPFQNVEVTKVYQSLPPTEVPLEQLVSNSSEPEVSRDRKLGQLFPPLHEALVQTQEELNLENQLHPAMHAESKFEKLNKLSGTISDDQQGQFHLPAASQFDLDHSLDSESRKHVGQQNLTVSSQLEEITASHSVSEAKKNMQPDKPIAEPLHPDSLYPGLGPSQRNTIQQQTTQHLSQTYLPVELDAVLSREENKINGNLTYLSGTGKALIQPVYSVEMQEDRCISGTIDHVSGSLSTPFSKAATEEYGIAVPESNHVAKQAVEPVTAELEEDYTNMLDFMAESGKHLDVSLPVPNTEEGGMLTPLPMIPRSEGEQPVLSMEKREETECSATTIIPTSKIKSASATQGSQNSDAATETTGPSLFILSCVADKTKAQTIPPESISSVPAAGQSHALSSTLTDEAEIEKNHFPETQVALPDSTLETTCPVGAGREESLRSLIATKIVSEESRTIFDDVIFKERKELPPFSSAMPVEQHSAGPISYYGASEEEKQAWSPSVLNEESIDVSAGKAAMGDSQCHLPITADSDNGTQDVKLYGPIALQSELEGMATQNAAEEKYKQETLLYSPLTVTSVSVPQKLLYHKEKEKQEGRTSETECSKEQDAPLQSSALKQELKDSDLLQSMKQTQLEEIQLYCSATLQDSSQLAGETRTEEQDDSLIKTGDVDSVVFVLSQLMDEAEKQEIQKPWPEAAQVECKQPVLSVDEKREVQYPSITTPRNISHLDSSYSKETQPHSFDEQQNQASEQENQPCKPATAKVMPEEPMSITEFLLSEASGIDIYVPLTTEEKNIEIQTPLEEAGLRSGSAAPSETDVMTEKKTASSMTHCETEQFARKSQVDSVTSTESIPERVKTTHLSSTETTLKIPENYLCEEKGLKDQEKLREAISSSNLDQGDTVDISESSEAMKTNASLISSVHSKKPSLESVEAISMLETNAFNGVRDLIVDHEHLVYKPCRTCSEDLKADHQEIKKSDSKATNKEKGTEESRETEKEVSNIPENMDDNILSSINNDYVEKHLIGNMSFTQKTREEKSVQEAQRTFDEVNEKSVEAAYSKNSFEFSLLERDLDEAFNGMMKKECITVSHEDISKPEIDAEIIDAARDDDKSTGHECNLKGANAPLFSTEKDELSQSPFASLPVNPEVLEVPAALPFSHKDLYEEAIGESKEKSYKCTEVKNTDLPFHIRDHVPDNGTETHLEMGISSDYTPNNLEESKKEEALKHLLINEEALRRPKVTEDTYEPNEKKNGSVNIQPEVSVQTEKSLNDTVIKEAAEIVSDIKIEICHPTHAIPFGSGLYNSGASSDDSGQIGEEQSLSEEAGQLVPEEASDEESSPILNYADTVYQNEPPGQDKSKDTACFAVTQNQQYETTEICGNDEDLVAKPIEKNTQSLEAFSHLDRQSERQSNDACIPTEGPAKDTQVLDQKDFSFWEFEGQIFENRIGENIAHDLTQQATETADKLATESKSNKPFEEIDYSLLSHDFDTYPLYSIKEEENSDVDEDLAELLNYEVITHDDVYQEDISSETAHEELLLDDMKYSDHISDTYEFVNEQETSMYAEDRGFELLDLEMLPKNAPENEVLQKEVHQAHLDSYCYQCKCPISSEDKLFEQHRDHTIADLGSAVTELKGQLNGFQHVLQERSLKIEESVSEIEALFNSLEENCKEKEQLLEEQNESVVKMLIGHHERKAQSFEEAKNTKMEYLYEQMVNFQDYIDTAKETLETIIKETEELDDFAFLKSSEEINKRLLSALENIVTLEKMPAAFSQFELFAGGLANNERALQHIPVPHTPRLHPQDPNSATSTSIAVYWTVNEDDIIDFFQVYCMEEHPGSKEQSGFVEEYRVTVKESNCILEDLEPGHCYSVWVMAVSYTGCSFPSDKSVFRTAPPTPVIKSEECTVCWDTAIVRWSTSNLEATDSFTLEYCRQYSLEGEGLRSLAGIQQPEMKVHLESNVNYFFYVRAVNTFGTSEQSEASLISTKGTRFHIMRETVPPALQVSPNGTMISLPDDADITGISPVLGEPLPARGWHYWEITVSGCGAYKVGICSSILPKGSDLGQTNNSWCLHCSSKTSSVYKVLHNGVVNEVSVTEEVARIGILLDYNSGRLVFLNAARGQVLSAVKHKFTEAVHPAFVLEQLGFLNLHTGMELPECAKQS